MENWEFEENIAQMSKNNKEGLRNIYEEYNPMIYSAVFEILRNREDAEDVTSEFFIRFWDIGLTYQGGKGHRGWMLTIARNMALDYLRKRKRESLTGEPPEPAEGKREFPEEDICQKTALEQAMERLKSEEREIVNLKIMGELTFREIAEILKKPQGTVAWLYRTAISKLKEVQL